MAASSAPWSTRRERSFQARGSRSSTKTPTSGARRPPTRRAGTRSRTSRPGPYDVKVALQGFKEAIRSRVPVTVGQISRVDLTLTVGALTESVTVQSAAELLQTDKADTRTELKSTEITNLPLNQFRNYQALVVLVPGSMPATLPNAETDTPERSLNVSVNGQDGAANTTLTDGTRNVNVGCRTTTSTSRRQRRSSRSTSRRAAWMRKRAWRRASRLRSSPSRARTRSKARRSSSSTTRS